MGSPSLSNGAGPGNDQQSDPNANSPGQVYYCQVPDPATGEMTYQPYVMPDQPAGAQQQPGGGGGDNNNGPSIMGSGGIDMGACMMGAIRVVLGSLERLGTARLQKSLKYTRSCSL